MRRTISSTALVALVLAAVIVPASAASAGSKARIRHYEGQTSEDGLFAITTAVSNGVVRLRELTVSGTLGCEDGHASDLFIGFGWSPGIRLTDQRLNLAQTGFDLALLVTGRLGSHRGSGTLTLLIPGLTADEQAQICRMGELTWTLDRSARETNIPSGQAVRVQRFEGRRITVALGPSASEGTTMVGRLAPRPIRHYLGRTSQGKRMRVTTRRNDAGVGLLTLSWGWTLTCEDGTQVLGRTGYFFGGEGQVMPRGRIDLDLVSVGPGDAFHVHGELGAHVGSGTMSLTWPALTENLQAQLCTSGEPTWDLWRTDAGY